MGFDCKKVDDLEWPWTRTQRSAICMYAYHSAPRLAGGIGNSPKYFFRTKPGYNYCIDWSIFISCVCASYVYHQQKTYKYENKNKRTRASHIQGIKSGVWVAEDRPSSGGKAFDLRRTLPHVLVRLKQDDVNFGHEHTRKCDRRTNVHAYTQCVDLYLQTSHVNYV